jgi:hypothetical protein
MIDDQLFGNNPSYALARGIQDNVSPQPQIEQTENGLQDRTMSDEQLLQAVNTPLTGEEVAEKIAFLNQNGISVNKNTISFDEWDKYHEWHKTQSTDFWSALVEGGKHAAGDLAGGVWAAATDWKKLAAATGLSVAASPLVGFGAVYGQTLAEGAARGTRDLAGLFVMAFNNPDSPLYRLTTHQGDKQAMYQDFMDLSDWNQRSMDIINGKSNVLMPDKATYEKLLGKPMGDTLHDFVGVNHELATAASYILDPVTLLTLGGGKIAQMAGINLVKAGVEGTATNAAKLAATSAQAKASFLSQGLLHAGTWAEKSGKFVARPAEKAWASVHKVLDDVFGAAAVRMSQTGVKARKITPGMPPQSLAHAVIGTVGMYGLFHIPYGMTLASIYGGAKGLEMAGALGKNLGKGMTAGVGFFDAARKLNAGYVASNGGGTLVANAIDKSEVMAGYFKDVATSAVKGSLFGGVIGYASAGEEGLAGGLGGGIVIGAGAHHVGLAYGSVSGAFRKQTIARDFNTLQDEHTKGGFIAQRDNINKLVSKITADHGEDAGLRAMAHILKTARAEGGVTTFLDTKGIIEALKGDPSSHPYLYVLGEDNKPVLNANGERVLTEFGQQVLSGVGGRGWNGMFTHVDPATGKTSEKPFAVWTDGRTGNKHIIINVDGFIYDRDASGNFVKETTVAVPVKQRVTGVTEGERPTANVKTEKVVETRPEGEVGESGIPLTGKLRKRVLLKRTFEVPEGTVGSKKVELQGPGLPMEAKATDIAFQDIYKKKVSRNAVLEEMFHMFNHIQREVYGRSVRDDVRGWFIGDGMNKGKLETEKTAAVDVLHKAVDRVVTEKGQAADVKRAKYKSIISDIANDKIGPHNVGELDVVFEELAAKMFLAWEEGKPFDYVFRDGDMGIVQNLFGTLKDKYAQHVLREAGQLGANVRTEQHFTEWFQRSKGSQFRFDKTLDQAFKNGMRVFRDHGMKHAGYEPYKIGAMSIPKLTAMAYEQGYEHLLARDDQGNVTGMKPLEQINKEKHEMGQNAIRELIKEGVINPEILNGLDIVFSDRRNDLRDIGERTIDEIAEEGGRNGRTFFQAGDPDAFGPGLDDLRQAQKDNPSTGNLPPQGPEFFGARGRPRTTLGTKSRLRADIVAELNHQINSFGKRGGTLILRGVPGEKAFAILEKSLPKNVSANIRAMSMPIFDGGKTMPNVMNAVYHGFTQNIDGHTYSREHGDTFAARNTTFIPYEMDIRATFRNPKSAQYDYKQPHFSAIARVLDLDVLQRRINTLWEEEGAGMARLYADRSDFENHVYQTMAKYASEKSIPAREFFGDDKEAWSRRNFVMAAIGAFPNADSRARFVGALDQDWHRFLSRKDELNNNGYNNPWTRLRLDNIRQVAAVDKSKAQIPFTEKAYYRAQVPTPRGVNSRFYRGSNQVMYQHGDAIPVETVSARGLLESQGIDTTKFKSDQAMQEAAARTVGDPVKLYKAIAAQPDFKERPNPIALFQRAEEYGALTENERSFLAGNFKYASENLGDILKSEAIRKFIDSTAGKDALIFRSFLDEHAAMGGTAELYNEGIKTGQPVVLMGYHGTESAELGKTRMFDESRLGEKTNVESSREAQWFAGSRLTSESYAFKGTRIKATNKKLDNVNSQLSDAYKQIAFGSLHEELGGFESGGFSDRLARQSRHLKDTDWIGYEEIMTAQESSELLRQNHATLSMNIGELKGIKERSKREGKPVNKNLSDAIQKLESIEKEYKKIRPVENEYGPILENLIAFRNPLVYDYNGAMYSEASSPVKQGHPGLSDLIRQARKDGRDGVIALNLIDGGSIDNHYAVLRENIKTHIATLPDESTVGYKINRGLNGNEGQSLMMQVGEEPPSRIFGTPNAETSRISDEYRLRKGITARKGVPIIKLNEEKAFTIGSLYEQMENNPTDPLVRAAYKAMADETLDQFRSIIARGYRVEMYGEKAEPYKNSSEMLADLRNNKHLYIFPTGDAFGGSAESIKNYEGHPLLADSGFRDINNKPMVVNDVFRFVHDFFGHSELGNSFGPIGEENAWDVHSRMYSPLARRAMTVETRGQNSWVNFYNEGNKAKNNILRLARKAENQGNHEGAKVLRQKVKDMGDIEFAPQKVGLLPEWVSKLDEEYTPEERQQRGEHKFLRQEGEEYPYREEEGTQGDLEGLEELPDEDKFVPDTEDDFGPAKKKEKKQPTAEDLRRGQIYQRKGEVDDVRNSIDDYLAVSEFRKTVANKTPVEQKFELEEFLKGFNKNREVKISRIDVERYGLRVGEKRYGIDEITKDIADKYIEEKYSKALAEYEQLLRIKEQEKKQPSVVKVNKSRDPEAPEQEAAKPEKSKKIPIRQALKLRYPSLTEQQRETIWAAREVIKSWGAFGESRIENMEAKYTAEQMLQESTAILEDEVGMKEIQNIALDLISNPESNLEVHLSKEDLTPESIERLGQELDISGFADDDIMILHPEMVERLGLEWHDDIYSGNNPMNKSVFQDYMRALIPSKRKKSLIGFEENREDWKMLTDTAEKILEERHKAIRSEKQVETKTTWLELYEPASEGIYKQKGWSAQTISRHFEASNALAAKEGTPLDKKLRFLTIEQPMTAEDHLQALRDAEAMSVEFWDEYNKLVDEVREKRPEIPVKKITSEEQAAKYIKQQKAPYDFFQKRIQEFKEILEGKRTKLTPPKTIAEGSKEIKGLESGYSNLLASALYERLSGVVEDIVNNPQNSRHGERSDIIEKLKLYIKKKELPSYNVALSESGALKLSSLYTLMEDVEVWNEQKKIYEKVYEKAEDSNKKRTRKKVEKNKIEMDFWKDILGEDAVTKELVGMQRGLDAKRLLEDPNVHEEIKRYIRGESDKLPLNKDFLASLAEFNAENIADAVADKHEELGANRSEWMGEDWTEEARKAEASPEGKTKDGVTKKMIGSEIPEKIKMKRQSFADSWNGENKKSIKGGVRARTAETISDAEIMAVVLKKKKQGVKVYDENGNYVRVKPIKELTVEDEQQAYLAAYNEVKGVLRNPNLWDITNPGIIAEAEAALREKIDRSGASAKLTSEETQALRVKSDNLTVVGGITRDGQYSVSEKVNADGTTSKVVTKNATEASPYTGQPEPSQVVAIVDTETQALAALRKHDSDTRTAVEVATGQPTKNPLSSDVKEYNPEQVAQIIEQAKQIDAERPPAPKPVEKPKSYAQPRTVENPAPAPERTPAAAQPVISPQLSAGVKPKQATPKAQTQAPKPKAEETAPQSRNVVSPQETRIDSSKHPQFDNAIEALVALGENRQVAINFVKTSIAGDMSLPLTEIIKRAMGLKASVQKSIEVSERNRQSSRKPTTTPAQVEPPKVTILPAAEPAKTAPEAPQGARPAPTMAPPSGVPQGTPRQAAPAKPAQLPVESRMPAEVQAALTQFRTFNSQFQHGNTVRQGSTYVNDIGYIIQQKGFAKWYIFNPGKVYVGSTQDEREAVRLIVKDYHAIQ